ncbi:MAG: bacteriohemerythrin [Candidatus Deferrimicrobiaceae bacterium]
MEQQTWNDEFRLGIRKIDEEHETFLNILNSLEDAISQGKGRTEVGKAINELMLYAYNHFTEEEQMLRDYGYPDYEHHREIHEAATGKILEIAEQHDAGIADASQVISAMTDWLMKHIQGTDKKYVAFLAAKGVV